MSGQKVILQSQIDGDFDGFDDEVLFRLSNGTYWVQDEYKYWYHYSYMPQVNLLNIQGRIHLQVVGQSEIVQVREITGVIESRINGEFKGWEGETSYQLINGQVWQQASYKYEYKYAYMPEVTIFDPGGGNIMQVADTKAKVRRIK